MHKRKQLRPVLASRNFMQLITTRVSNSVGNVSLVIRKPVSRLRSFLRTDKSINYFTRKQVKLQHLPEIKPIFFSGTRKAFSEMYKASHDYRQIFASTLHVAGRT